MTSSRVYATAGLVVASLAVTALCAATCLPSTTPLEPTVTAGVWIDDTYEQTMTAVPFHGRAPLVSVYDLHRRPGQALSGRGDLPVIDQHEWLTWRLPVGAEVLAPGDGLVVKADTTVACATGSPDSGLRIEQRAFPRSQIELLGVVPSVAVGDTVAAGQGVGVVGRGSSACPPGLSLGLVPSGGGERTNFIFLHDTLPFYRLSREDWVRLLDRSDAAERVSKPPATEQSGPR